MKNMYYAMKPEYSYETSENSEIFELKEVVEDWYDAYGQHQFIKEVGKESSDITIYTSGGGCSLIYSAIEDRQEGTYIFKKNEVMICS